MEATIRRSSNHETEKTLELFYNGKPTLRAGSPKHTLLLLLALLVRSLRLIARVLRMLLGLRGMFLALGMIILTMRVGCGAMRLRRVFVLLRRLVVIFFHDLFPWFAENRLWSAKMPAVPQLSFNSGRTKCGWCLYSELRTTEPLTDDLPRLGSLQLQMHERTVSK